jgi:hypothetical protein
LVVEVPLKLGAALVLVLGMVLVNQAALPLALPSC